MRGCIAAVATIALLGCAAAAPRRETKQGIPGGAELAGRVHRGHGQIVAAALHEDCALGVASACAGLADLVALGFASDAEYDSARALYLRACSRGHTLACSSLEHREVWLTLPLLQPRHVANPVVENVRAPIDRIAADICVDRHGVPTRVHLRGSTGGDADDHRIGRALRDWRFAPVELTDPGLLAACQHFVLGIE